MKTNKILIRIGILVGSLVILAIMFRLMFLNFGEKLEHKIILSKSNESYFNKPLPDGWCRFFYKTHENSEWIEFKDKCDKYNVGDTIVGSSKNYR